MFSEREVKTSVISVAVSVIWPLKIGFTLKCIGIKRRK